MTALNLVFFPACTLGQDVLAEILAGGLDALREAGVCLVGGHTVEDDELKYGLAVTGLIDPARVVRNATACPGDRLVLTKPLGTGIIATAIKADMASDAAAAEAIRWMTTLNAAAAGLMVECGASACTDVTGFGLLGHASEMARGSGVTVEFMVNAVPLMTGVGELVADGLVPAGCYRNRDHYAPLVSPAAVNDERLLPLFDPQTSGGLLIALPVAAADCFLAAAAARGVFAAAVGRVLPAGEHPLVLV